MNHELLKALISTPSVSRDEKAAADIMEQAMKNHGLAPQRFGNNVWATTPHWNPHNPTILLNAHIDTVKPVATWTRNPFTPSLEGDRLYGLGSNDCGGGLVTLLEAFRLLHSRQTPDSPRNLIYLVSCEEEISGAGGIRSVLPVLFPEFYAGCAPMHKEGEVLPTPPADITPIDVSGGLIALVGEPTGMQPAIAERGLMVIDGTAHGKSGHAARNEGVNAIYEALDDLLFIRSHQFEKVSPLLGPTKMQCTIVNSGTQHNVVPDECRFTIDVRTNELYTNEAVFAFLQKELKSDLKARSFHLHSSSLLEENATVEHPYNGIWWMHRFSEMGMTPFGSPTLSDQALMRFPSFKLGPGESSRSHSADEFICLSEMEHAIKTYLTLLG